jgi:hypothetical protein
MSWTDQKSIRVINFLKNKFNINTFVETGAFKGINAKFHSKNFKTVLTCENNNAYYEQAKQRLKDSVMGAYCRNVTIVKEDSPKFLKNIPDGKYIFYLDAHFYNPKIPKNKRFVVLDELKNMIKFKDSIIIIHDFDNGLGHITYDGLDLDLNLLKNRLKKINNKFYLYTNTLYGCDPLKPIAKDIQLAGLEVDYDVLDNLNYAWSEPKKTYRGFLYCLPNKLNEIELKQLGLRKC